MLFGRCFPSVHVPLLALPLNFLAHRSSIPGMIPAGILTLQLGFRRCVVGDCLFVSWLPPNRHKSHPKSHRTAVRHIPFHLARHGGSVNVPHPSNISIALLFMHAAFAKRPTHAVRPARAVGPLSSTSVAPPARALVCRQPSANSPRTRAPAPDAPRGRVCLFSPATAGDGASVHPFRTTCDASGRD